MTLSIRTLLYDVLLLLELGLFFLFFAPLFLRIFNAGNLFGMAVSAICFLLTLFHRPFGQLLSRIWGNLCGKCVLSILALLLTAGIAFAGFCSVKMVQYYQNPPQTPCTVVVLGCKVKGTVPSLMLQRRLEAAKDYLQQHPDIPCIVSGKGMSAFVVFFTVLARLLLHFLPEAFASSLPCALLLGFLELTSGVLSLPCSRAGFLACAALLGWGGMSVHFQTRSMLAASPLSARYYLKGKALQALLSLLLALPALPFLFP